MSKMIFLIYCSQIIKENLSNSYSLLRNESLSRNAFKLSLLEVGVTRPQNHETTAVQSDTREKAYQVQVTDCEIVLRNVISESSSRT